MSLVIEVAASLQGSAHWSFWPPGTQRAGLGTGKSLWKPRCGFWGWASKGTATLALYSRVPRSGGNCCQAVMTLSRLRSSSWRGAETSCQSPASVLRCVSGLPWEWIAPSQTHLQRTETLADILSVISETLGQNSPATLLLDFWPKALWG